MAWDATLELSPLDILMLIQRHRELMGELLAQLRSAMVALTDLSRQ